VGLIDSLMLIVEATCVKDYESVKTSLKGLLRLTC
jgi:hypothetical protein